MARNTVPIIIGAVLFGLLAIGLTFYSLLGGGGGAPAPAAANTADGTPAAEPSSVFVARRPIAPRTVITRDMIEETETDASATPNAITNPYDIVGRLANRTIQAGQILTSESITPGLGRVIPANIAIPAGLRGVAVWVNPDQTAAGLVDVGDRVDVIATHDLKMEKSGNQVVVGAVDFTAGRTIAQDLEVLAVDRSITEMRPSTPAPSASGSAPGTAPGAAPTPAPGQPGAPPAAQQPAPPPGQERRTRVILAAAPAVAQSLVAANSKGDLHITIRNPVARDRFPLAEAREYPSRVAAGPPQQRAAAPAGGGGGGGTRSGATSYARSEPPLMPSPSFPSPAPQPLPPFSPGAGTTTPMPVPEKDVTVIRGTEKTRVIVPR